MARTKQTARKHTAGRGQSKKLATKVRTPRADPDPAPPTDVPSIIRKAHQQLADAWVAGSMAEREKLITRLWVRGAKSDVERFKMNWHTFKMRLRRVDASSIHTCCELIQRIRDKAAEDNAPRLEAAAKRHKQAIDTKTPQEKQSTLYARIINLFGQMLCYKTLMPLNQLCVLLDMLHALWM